MHLPKKFENNLKQKIGDEEYASFKAALDSPQPVSIRVHPQKGKDLFKNEEKIPWCNYGRYLEKRPAFVWDPLYHAGTYYAQDASSMFFANAIDFNEDIKVLDLCAAREVKVLCYYPISQKRACWSAMNW